MSLLTSQPCFSLEEILSRAVHSTEQRPGYSPWIACGLRVHGFLTIEVVLGTLLTEELKNKLNI